MNTWIDFMARPVEAFRPREARPDVPMTLREEKAPARIVRLLSDGQWRTAVEIAEALGLSPKDCASNLVRMRHRSMVVNRSSATKHPWRPKQMIQIWSVA